MGGGDKVHYGLCESINKLNEVLSFVMGRLQYAGELKTMVMQNYRGGGGGGGQGTLWSM